MTDQPSQNVVIYETADGAVAVDVQFSEETVWLSLNQMATLFERDKSVISRHLKNVFQEGELEFSSVVAKNATTAADGKCYQVDYYNLDAILSVGYRVNSKRGTQFRRWASRVLKDHLVQGYSLNQKRLTETSLTHLQETVQLLSKTLLRENLVTETGAEVLRLVTAYSKTWDILLRYDENRLQGTDHPSEPLTMLSVEEAREGIAHLKSKLLQAQEASSLFGQERGEGLQGILGALDQTFDGQPVYTSSDEKAAHLLYFIIKDHPFVDGNKRIGSLLFLLYLKQKTQMADNTLIALALLIAESAPSQKTSMVMLIQNLLR